MSDIDSSSAPAAGGCSSSGKIRFCEDAVTAPPMLALYQKCTRCTYGQNSDPNAEEAWNDVQETYPPHTSHRRHTSRRYSEVLSALPQHCNGRIQNIYSNKITIETARTYQTIETRLTNKVWIW